MVIINLYNYATSFFLINLKTQDATFFFVVNSKKLFSEVKMTPTCIVYLLYFIFMRNYIFDSKKKQDF